MPVAPSFCRRVLLAWRRRCFFLRMTCRLLVYLYRYETIIIFVRSTFNQRRIHASFDSAIRATQETPPQFARCTTPCGRTWWMPGISFAQGGLCHGRWQNLLVVSKNVFSGTAVVCHQSIGCFNRLNKIEGAFFLASLLYGVLLLSTFTTDEVARQTEQVRLNRCKQQQAVRTSVPQRDFVFRSCRASTRRL